MDWRVGSDERFSVLQKSGWHTRGRCVDGGVSSFAPDAVRLGGGAGVFRFIRVSHHLHFADANGPAVRIFHAALLLAPGAAHLAALLFVPRPVPDRARLPANSGNLAVRVAGAGWL